MPVGALLIFLPSRDVFSQVPPGYQELFRDPPRTDELTPADLPNLGRQVVLEAISMYSHALSEIRNSPYSNRLYAAITTLWNAANDFTAALSFSPLETAGIPAARLTFPELEAAFYQLRDTLGNAPDIGPKTAGNLADLSRVMAVIGPLLQQAAAVQPQVADPRIFDPALITNQAREIASAIDALRTQLKPKTGRPECRKPEALTRQIDVLQTLIQGFERISSGAASQRDVVASFRPDSQPGAIDHPGSPAHAHLGGPESSLWRTIEQQISAMEARLQIPRVIVVRPAGERNDLPDPGTVAAIDRAIHEAEALADRTSSQASRLPRLDRTPSDARNLATRLYLARQYLLGRAPREQVNEAHRQSRDFLART